jgi:hypothetical protein
VLSLSWSHSAGRFITLPGSTHRNGTHALLTRLTAGLLDVARLGIDLRQEVPDGRHDLGVAHFPTIGGSRTEPVARVRPRHPCEVVLTRAVAARDDVEDFRIDLDASPRFLLRPVVRKGSVHGFSVASVPPALRPSAGPTLVNGTAGSPAVVSASDRALGKGTHAR